MMIIEIVLFALVGLYVGFPYGVMRAWDERLYLFGVCLLMVLAAVVILAVVEKEGARAFGFRVLVIGLTAGVWYNVGERLGAAAYRRLIES